MEANKRKKVSVISKYVLEEFSEADWYTLGQVTGKLDLITSHARLLRSFSFGDEDYSYCVAEVLDKIFSQDESGIDDLIDYFDIDLWYQQKEPTKHQRIFIESSFTRADFWIEGYLKLFVSHLSSNKERMSAMKSVFQKWGISAFIAHEDIEPTREWRDEVEAALETMEVMAAVVEPGFKESDWCSQEVGYALGRKVDIVPLRAGLDPFGFFGKYQGIQIKGKTPVDVANEVTSLLLRKPKHREKLLQSMVKSFSRLDSTEKILNIKLLDSWSVTSDIQICNLLEQSSLSNFEQEQLKEIIARVGAFKGKEEQTVTINPDDDIPF